MPSNIVAAVCCGRLSVLYWGGRPSPAERVEKVPSEYALAGLSFASEADKPIHL